MNADRFDELTRAVTASRRLVLGGGLASAAAGLCLMGGEARKKRRKKRKKRRKKSKKARPNAYGCLNVGATCKKAGRCCSGICQGKKGKRKCRAHDTGTCKQNAPAFCEGDPVQTLCNNSPQCACLKTTGGSSICGSLSTESSQCAECRTDADCLALGLPPGSACVPFSTGVCAGNCPTGMACAAPCGVSMLEG